MEYQQGYVYHRFENCCREGSLDKDATSHDDLFDAFSLSSMFWR